MKSHIIAILTAADVGNSGMHIDTMKITYNMDKVI